MKKYATLRPLAGSKGKDLRKGFQAMARALKSSGERGRLQFRIVDRKSEYWVLDLIPGQSAVRKGEAKDPDFEILTRRQTWAAIASGVLSPAEAFLKGELRVRGDAALGKRILGRITRPGGDLEIC